MENKTSLEIFEKLFRLEDFSINFYSSVSRRIGRREKSGADIEKIAKEKVDCKNLLQTIIVQIKNNKSNLKNANFSDSKNFDLDKIITKYQVYDDDNKPYASLVKVYELQRELSNIYLSVLNSAGNYKELEFLSSKANHHFEMISQYVDVEFEKYESFSSFWS